MNQYNKRKFIENDSSDDEYINDCDKEIINKINKIFNKKKTVIINDKIDYEQDQDLKT